LNLRKRATSLFISIVIGYLIVLLLVRIFESRLIFFPDYPGRLSGDWTPRGLPIENIWLTSADGTRLHGWWIPNEKAKFTFLAFHGNAGNIADRAPIYEFLRDTPANVFALEYRGYGHSGGKPSEAGFYRDADAALDYVIKAKQIDPKTIISFGQSLGTAVAAHLAARHPLGGVVLEAPFPSASRVARQVFWFLPGASLLVYSQFDTKQRLKEINAPILIVQCTHDPVLPPRLGQEVYEQAQLPKEILQIEGYCHEEAAIIAPARYRAALDKFLNNIEKSSSPLTPQ
jgi:uncharacterized protein